MFNYVKSRNKVGKIVAHSVIALLLIALFFGSFKIISAGHRGVKLTFGKVTEQSLGEGIHFKIPLAQRIIELDVRTVKYEADALAYSKDIQTVNAKLALNYHLTPNDAYKLYQDIGTDYESRIINPAMQESLKAVSAKFTAQELIEKRAIVKDEVKNQLTERLTERNIMVDELSIVNFDFSDEFEKSVEAKQVAQQQALKAENDLKRIKTEAEQRVAQAEAEARAIKIQAEAITQQGGQDYVNLKAVEKWDGKLPINFVPGSAIPFLTLK